MTEHKPHKWHDLIVAWAGGARVERRQRGVALGLWTLCPDSITPNWSDHDLEFRLHDPYRIAEPEPKERVVFCKVKSVSENHPYVSRYANVTIADYGNVIKIEIV